MQDDQNENGHQLSQPEIIVQTLTTPKGYLIWNERILDPSHHKNWNSNDVLSMLGGRGCCPLPLTVFFWYCMYLWNWNFYDYAVSCYQLFQREIIFISNISKLQQIFFCKYLITNNLSLVEENNLRLKKCAFHSIYFPNYQMVPL